MNSQELIQKDATYIWHPFTPLQGMQAPLPIVRAEGCYLYTEDGRAILDAIASWWVNLHGHAHPHIAKAIGQQALQLEHVIFAGFTHAPAVSLAERLLQILPENLSKVFFSDNGSTACEVALKMALQYWYNKGQPKTKVIALEGAYHGDTFGAMSVGDRSPLSAPTAPLLFEVCSIALPMCHKETCCAGQRELSSLCGGVAQSIAAFEAAAASGEVAAFIYEPLVQGASGMRMYSVAILEKLLAIAKKYEVICIADEVMTGFGRTGQLFASLHLSEQPDIVCLSKGLTGGALPLGVTACAEYIIEAYRSDDLLKTFFHGHSFTANPLACAAALASLDLLLTEECLQNIARIQQQHLAFEERLQGHSKVREVRVLGTIVAVELDTDKESGYFNEARSSLYQFFLDRNILLRPLGNIIYILPPYAIAPEGLEDVYQAIEALLAIL